MKIYTKRNEDIDIRNQFCRCSNCGITAKCTPNFDFYGEENKPLICEFCFRSSLKLQGISEIHYQAPPLPIDALLSFYEQFSSLLDADKFNETDKQKGKFLVESFGAMSRKLLLAIDNKQGVVIDKSEILLLAAIKKVYDVVDMSQFQTDPSGFVNQILRVVLDSIDAPDHSDFPDVISNQ